MPKPERAAPAPDPDLEPIRDPIEPRLTRATYTPAPISILNGVLLWGQSRIYRQRFNIGVNEWRILGTISNHPGTTFSDAVNQLEMNKAIVSRSVSSLIEKGYAVAEHENRQRRLYLTRSGVEIFHRIRPIAEERERILLQSLTPDEVASLRAILLKMVDQAPALHEFDRAQLRGPAHDDPPGDD